MTLTQLLTLKASAHLELTSVPVFTIFFLSYADYDRLRNETAKTNYYHQSENSIFDMTYPPPDEGGPSTQEIADNAWSMPQIQLLGIPVLPLDRDIRPMIGY